MPVPKLFLAPVPVAIGVFITYELGFCGAKPEWYRKGIANEYRQVSPTISALQRPASPRPLSAEALSCGPCLLQVTCGAPHLAYAHHSVVFCLRVLVASLCAGVASGAR